MQGQNPVNGLDDLCVCLWDWLACRPAYLNPLLGAERSHTPCQWHACFLYTSPAVCVCLCSLLCCQAMVRCLSVCVHELASHKQEYNRRLHIVLAHGLVLRLSVDVPTLTTIQFLRNSN